MVVFIMIAIFSYGLSLCTGSGKGAVKISKMIVKIKKIDKLGVIAPQRGYYGKETTPI